MGLSMVLSSREESQCQQEVSEIPQGHAHTWSFSLLSYYYWA